MSKDEALKVIGEKGYVQDIGQLDKAVRRDLDKMVRRGDLKKGLYWWPWITAGTVRKTTYYQEGWVRERRKP